MRAAVVLGAASDPRNVLTARPSFPRERARKAEVQHAARTHDAPRPQDASADLMADTVAARRSASMAPWDRLVVPAQAAREPWHRAALCRPERELRACAVADNSDSRPVQSVLL